MATDIKFNYLYRDASNYKQFGNVIMSNLNNMCIDLINDIIRRNLIDGEFFNASEWGSSGLIF